jgi:L-histidine Nalpha-methyltransferase
MTLIARQVNGRRILTRPEKVRNAKPQGGDHAELVLRTGLSDKRVMPQPAHVLVHPSQFPDGVRRDFIASLRSRRVNHKFHYDSVKQAQKWLAVHQACSPSRTDAGCAAAYNRSCAAAAGQLPGRRVHVVGLGCGGGRKDTRLLRLLKRPGRDLFYTPCDVSTAMVLVARQAALGVVADRNCFPLVCDLATAEDLRAVLSAQPAVVASRIFTFFGMIPNFEPGMILPKLAGLLRRGDLLLFSANLAPGPDYAAGMRRVLPQYDNALTRDWLMTFLLDLGVERTDGNLRFKIEGRRGFKRIAADFWFTRTRRLEAYGRGFEFRRGQTLRLFFSYRYTPALTRSLLQQHGLRVLGEWIAGSGEEGAFLCRRENWTRDASIVNRKS